MTAERWSAIPAWPGYEASDCGQIRSVDRIVGPRIFRGLILKTWIDPRWNMPKVTLSNAGRQLNRGVGSLVLSAFVGPCPPGLECCHNDGDSTNNRLTNLRWDTHSSNVFDQVRHGTHPEASRDTCKFGHQLQPLEDGRRRGCPTCILDNRRRRRQLRRQTLGGLSSTAAPIATWDGRSDNGIT